MIPKPFRTPIIHARHEGRPTVVTVFISSSSGPPGRNARSCLVTRRGWQVHPGGGVPPLAASGHGREVTLAELDQRLARIERLLTASHPGNSPDAIDGD